MFQNSNVKQEITHLHDVETEWIYLISHVITRYNTTTIVAVVADNDDVDDYSGLCCCCDVTSCIRAHT